MNDKGACIPFLNLGQINARYIHEIEKRFSEFLVSGTYINGSFVKQFEQSFADFCGTQYCVGVGNGLDALTIILKGYIELKKIKSGDEVIVAANTFIATILSIIHAGLKPVLVEPDEKTFNISVDGIIKKISSRTKVILPTHLYGQLAPMDEINELSKEKGLLVITDSAQAHGAKDLYGRVAGNFGEASAFSFYPTKNLGALGDGGAIVTNDKDLAEIVRSMANYGTSTKYCNERLGVNSRLDEIQAIILLEKLKALNQDNINRRSIAREYLSRIVNDKIELPFWDGSDCHVFYAFVIKVKNRNDFCKYLDESNIGYLIHYPVPPHKQKALKRFENVSLPITERMHNEVVSIPLNIGMKRLDVERVIKILNEY